MGICTNLSAALYAESIYVPLIYAGLWLTVLNAEAGQGPRGRWMAFAAGAIYGIAEATRPVALPLFAAAIGWILWQSRREGSCRPTAASIVALATGFVAGLLPFAVRDLVVLGHVAVFTSRGSEAFYASPLGQELANLGIDPSQTGVLPALLAALQQPRELAGALARALPIWFSSTFLVGGWAPVGEPLLQLVGYVGVLVRVALWLVALLGLAWVARRPAPRLGAGGLLLAAVLATHVPFISLGGALVRYRAVADPIFIIWIVAGATALYARLRRPAVVPLTYGALAATG